MTHPLDSDTHNPLCLEQCPDCGYSLIGLPDQGRCPECGFMFDKQTIVLYGSRDSTSSPGWSARGLPPDIAPIGFVVLIAMVVCFMATTALGVWGTIPLILLAFLAWQVFRWARRTPQNLPGPIQMRLCPDGFAIRRGQGPAKKQPWSQDDYVQILGPMFIHGKEVAQYTCRITKTQVPGLPSRQISEIKVIFLCPRETAEHIRRRLREWGLRTV